MDYQGIHTVGSDLVVEGIRHFTLPETLDCGQAFRWEPAGESSWQGIARGHFLRLTHEGDQLILHDTTPMTFETVWEDYFDLRRDYGALKEAFSQDETLERTVTFAPGIRVLRQEPWEALCCFIISQNNNIKRIKGIVARLCELFGEPIEGGFAFPTAQMLAEQTIESLAPLRSGFRAKYLLDAAQKVAKGELVLEPLYTAPLDEARQSLMTVHGIGPKVADCVLLYGLGRIECVPMDVWMKRAMASLFPQGLPEFALPVAGIAQQYIFHYSRHNSALLTV
ncbi:DNA glycosylase [Oscillospiraceae bacterium MB08-C2-2]|nr:DNA glycosylase [Oscillospiraceae bacterium MB08-C2-2]